MPLNVCADDDKTNHENSVSFFLHCDSLQIYISNNAQTRKLNDRNKQKNYNKKKKTNGTQNHSHGHVVFTWHVSIQMKPFSFCVYGICFACSVYLIVQFLFVLLYLSVLLSRFIFFILNYFLFVNFRCASDRRLDLFSNLYS